MIKRQNIKKENKVKVTFVLPYDADQPNISVVGDFNDWTPDSTKLVKRNNGTCSASVSLEPGQRYLFRYYAGDTWFNDEEADGYAMGEHGAENCVLLT